MGMNLLATVKNTQEIPNAQTANVTPPSAWVPSNFQPPWRAPSRNLALAGQAGLNVLTPCACCFGTLRHAIALLDEDAALRARITQALAAEGLAWSGAIEVEHVLPVLARVIGVDALAAGVRAPRTGLRVAAQYGCHTLRPSNMARFDNPLAPTIFECGSFSSIWG